MPAEVSTCPKCGALITPQLSRCRQCKTYLHGTSVEGFVFEKILPENLRHSPGTGLILGASIFYYALMVLLAGLDQLLAFSGYTLDQLGSTDGIAILRGEYWRFVTSMFTHANLIHLAFNMSALNSAGPLVEEAFDRKKMLLIYLVSGVLSMVTSHVFNVLILGHVLHSSVGASGAISGMIGAALFAARRMGTAGRPVVQGMTRWAVYMGVFGLAVSGVDNAAHAGGFVVGAIFGHLVPLGLTKTVTANRLSSFALLLGLALIGASFLLLFDRARGQPVALEDDAYPRAMFFFTTYEGAEWDHSGQKRAAEACLTKVQDGIQGQEAIRACELAIRAVPGFPPLYLNLAALYEQAGDPAQAKELRDLVGRLPTWD